MGNVLVSMSISVDGFIAGPDVGTAEPMGVGGERLHEWMFPPDPAEGGGARASESSPSTPDPVDAEIAAELPARTGAVVIGRRMSDLGVDIWGDTPFPAPTFVLTHRDREPLAMTGGTFTFVTDGIESAVQQAGVAAGNRDVVVLGGAECVQQAIRAGLIDEINLQLVPVLLGGGTRLFVEGAPPAELVLSRLVRSPTVTHLRYTLDH